MALVAAAKAGNKDEVKRLLQTCDVNETDSEGQTALHVAAQKGHMEVLKMLLSNKKVNVNYKDGNGWTPLHCAANTGQFKICERLLQQKNIEITNNNDGSSALFYVVRHTVHDPVVYHNVLSLLLDRGANLNARNNFGESALHSACLRGNIDAVRFLVLNRADLSIVNRTGETCLHYAVRASKTEFVRILLEAGANPSAPSERGTPLEVATKVGNKDIIQLVTEKLKNPHGTIDRFKDAHKAGYLSVHMKKTRWQRLFFVVRENQISYYKSDLETDPLGIFEMHTTIFKESPDKFEKTGCFKLEATTGKTLLLSAGSDGVRSNWFNAFRAAYIWRPQGMGENTSSTQIPAALSEKDKRELDEERMKAELIQLSQAFGNRLCADCNSKDPMWVSMNVGVFVCTECAAIHQQNRVSTIKCIYSTTDKWTSEQVNALKSHGNVRINAILEKNLPEHFEWTQPDDPWEKKEQYIKAKYVTKSYKSKEETRTILPEEMAFQYKMARYAAIEFRQDYDNLLEAMGRQQLCISLKTLRSIQTRSTYQQLATIVRKYLGDDSGSSFPITEKTLPIALEKYQKYKFLAANQAYMKSVLDATKFVKEALKNKATTKEELIHQLQDVVNLFEQKQAECFDLHTKIIYQWWLPQLVELLVVLDSRNLIQEVVPQSLVDHFVKNCATVLFLLSGEYLYDPRLETFVESNAPQQRREEEFRKLFELIKEKNRLHTEGLRKDVQTVVKENSHSSSKIRRVSTNKDSTDEEESMNEAVTGNGFYRLVDVEPEPEAELPLLKIWNKGSILHSLFAFIREIPEETSKQLLRVERTGQSSLSALKIEAHRTSKYVVYSLDNFLLNRTERVPFFEKLSGVFAFLNQLQSTWPEGDDGVLSSDLKQGARRQVFVLNYLLKDLTLAQPPFTIPEILFNWNNLVQILQRSVEFLTSGAELGQPRGVIRTVITLLTALISWTITQFASLQQADQTFLGVRFL